MNGSLPIMNAEELRWNYCLLRMAKALVPTAPVTRELKRRIRAYVHTPVSEIRDVYDDSRRYITVAPLPEWIRTEAQAAQHVRDHMWIPHPSCWSWDAVPGDIYSTRFKLCRRHGRWWAYLCFSVIQD